MIYVEFPDADNVKDELIEYSVITAFYNDKLIIVRHKDRASWEVPGGHREESETSEDTARRELYEETGAVVYDLKWVSTYSVCRDGVTSYGALYIADVKKLGELPGYEIVEIKFADSLPDNLTYPEIQPHLYNRVLEFIDS